MKFIVAERLEEFLCENSGDWALVYGHPPIEVAGHVLDGYSVNEAIGYWVVTARCLLQAADSQNNRIDLVNGHLAQRNFLVFSEYLNSCFPEADSIDLLRTMSQRLGLYSLCRELICERQINCDKVASSVWEELALKSVGFEAKLSSDAYRFLASADMEDDPTLSDLANQKEELSLMRLQVSQLTDELNTQLCVSRSASSESLRSGHAGEDSDAIILERYRALASGDVQHMAEQNPPNKQKWQKELLKSPFNVSKWGAIRRYQRRLRQQNNNN